MEGEMILIAEADSRIAELASIKLSSAGYLVIISNNYPDALKKAENNQLELFLIGTNLPENGGIEFCRILKARPEFKRIPLVLILDQNDDEADLTEIKADDFLVKPFTPKTLLSKVNENILKYKVLNQVNPLTKLPGKMHLVEDLQYITRLNEEFELVFADLKDFKIFNQVYGYEKGNELIKLLAETYEEELGRVPMAMAGLYHLGGDDFCFLMKAGYADEICRNIVDRFDRMIENYYRDDDRQRRGLVVTSRAGLLQQYPIMVLNLAIVSNRNREVAEWLEAETIGSEMMRYCKTMPGSRWVRDRRRS